MHDHDSRAFHLLDGILHIVELEVHAAAGIFKEVRFETHLSSIQRGEFHAVIRRQSAHEYFCNALRLEPLAQAGGPAMAVVEQAAVAVNARVRALWENVCDAVTIQLRRQFRAASPLAAAGA